MNWQQGHVRGRRAAMRRGIISLAVLAFVGMTLGIAEGRTAVASTEQLAGLSPLVFDSVTVVDVEHGQLHESQRVVIVGNRIRAIGNSSTTRIPKGARVVDAHGKYLIPGFWDLHTHSRRYATDFFYPLFIANGVTGIRDAASEVPLDTLRLWRQEIWAGKRVGPPRQILSGQSIDEQLGGCTRQKSLHTCVSSSADARHLVDSLKAAGADMIKTYGLGKAMYFVIASESRRAKIPFGGHLTAASAVDASDSGAVILDHINTAGGMGPLCWGRLASMEQCTPVVERFKHNGTWFVPTLIRLGARGAHSSSIFTDFYDRARKFWSDSTVINPYAFDQTGHEGEASIPRPPRPDSLASSDSLGAMRFMQRLSLPILAGTDAGAPVLRTMPPGFSLHAELAMYVAEGLTSLEALQTTTLNPAKFLHATDSLGTVAVGKLADLVLLDGDPLKDINNTTAIRAVVANGRYYDRAELDRLLAEVKAKAQKEPEPFGQARATN